MNVKNRNVLLFFAVSLKRERGSRLKKFIELIDVASIALTIN